MPTTLKSPGGWTFTHPQEEASQEELHKKLIRQKRAIKRNQLTRNFRVKKMFQQTKLQIDFIKGIKHISSWENKFHRLQPTYKDLDWLSYVEKCLKENEVGFLDANVSGETNKNVGHIRHFPKPQQMLKVSPVINDKVISQLIYDVPENEDIIEIVYARLKEAFPALASLFGGQNNIEDDPSKCYFIH